MSDTEQTIAAKFDTEVMGKINSSATHIDLFFHGKDYSFSKDQLPIKIGRDPGSCDIALASDVVSRVHCVIEVKEKQIGISDRSTNGTFIRIGRAEPFVIKNSFYPLIGQGNIKLGENFNDDDRDMIFFRMISRSVKRD